MTLPKFLTLFQIENLKNNQKLSQMKKFLKIQNHQKHKIKSKLTKIKKLKNNKIIKIYLMRKRKSIFLNY